MATFCRYFNSAQCSSCAWIELPYEAQLVGKERALREALHFFESFALERTTGSAQQGFRNRAKMGVTGTVEEPILGLVGETALDEGRELLACPIHHPRLNALLAALPPLIREHGLAPYRIQQRDGELKGLIAFHSPGLEGEPGQSYLRFVIRSRESVAKIRALLPALQWQVPELRCVSANIQPIPHAILEGPEELFLTEARAIAHQLGELTLELAPQAFVQTNVEVATALYRTAARWIDEARPARLLELYCGQGAFSFFAAPGVPALLGIEINADAVATARATAARLGLTGLSFKCLDATKIESELESFRPGLVLANPPRRGLGDGAALILGAAPRDFFYSSCSIESLAEDLKKFAPAYRLKRVQLFDMFPHTAHFETLVWLERR